MKPRRLISFLHRKTLSSIFRQPLLPLIIGGRPNTRHKRLYIIPPHRPSALRPVTPIKPVSTSHTCVRVSRADV